MKPDWSKAPEWATLYTAEWRSSNRVDCAIFEERPADPYAALKAAAKDPTKQIRVWEGNIWCGWRNNDRFWAFDCPLEDYEIRDKPVVKTAYRRLYGEPGKLPHINTASSPDSECFQDGGLDLPYKWLGPIEEFTYEEPQP